MRRNQNPSFLTFIFFLSFLKFSRNRCTHWAQGFFSISTNGALFRFCLFSMSILKYTTAFCGKTFCRVWKLALPLSFALSLFFLSIYFEHFPLLMTVARVSFIIARDAVLETVTTLCLCRRAVPRNSWRVAVVLRITHSFILVRVVAYTDKAQVRHFWGCGLFHPDVKQRIRLWSFQK